MHNVNLAERDAIFLTGAVQYMASEILEIAGSLATDLRCSVIIPRHIGHAIRSDQELFSTMPHVGIVGGGVLPGFTAVAEVQAAQCQTTPCLDSMEMTRCILEQLGRLRPDRNISQEALSKLMIATEEYILWCLQHAREESLHRLMLPAHLNTAMDDVRVTMTCWMGDIDTVQKLIDTGCFDVNRRYQHRDLNPFTSAIITDDMPLLTLLLRQQPDPTSLVTGAVTAAQLGELTSMQMLVDYGLDVNARDGTTGRTLLDISCGCGKIGVAELLLLRGAEPPPDGLSIICNAVHNAEDRERLDAARETYLNPGLK